MVFGVTTAFIGKFSLFRYICSRVIIDLIPPKWCIQPLGHRPYGYRVFRKTQHLRNRVLRKLKSEVFTAVGLTMFFWVKTETNDSKKHTVSIFSVEINQPWSWRRGYVPPDLHGVKPQKSIVKLIVAQLLAVIGFWDYYLFCILRQSVSILRKFTAVLSVRE